MSNLLLDQHDEACRKLADAQEKLEILTRQNAALRELLEECHNLVPTYMMKRIETALGEKNR